MRAFACSHCGQLLFFENSHCLRCGTALGFAPTELALSAMEPVGWNRYRTLRGTSSQLYKRCGRASLAACNWLLHDDDPEELCASCRLTTAAPVVKSDAELRAFAQAEHAKRRLLYQLFDLGLPIVSREQAPKHGLAFTLAFRTDERRVSTGHLEGVITLDLRECDNAHRERLRHQFGEPYRTLLGHAERAMRHSVQRHGFHTHSSHKDKPSKTDDADLQATDGEVLEPGAAESLFGRHAGHGPEQLAQLAERPEKLRRDLQVDTSEAGVTASDRKAGYGHTGKRNTKLNTEGMAYKLEDSTTDRPSRKSTRGGTNHVKPDANLTLRTRSTLNSAKSKATRSH